MKEFQKIIKMVRQDPERGIEMFYDRYGKIVESTARAICQSPETAKEVANDVLFKVWKKAKSRTVRKITNPQGWVYVMTANAAKSAKRQPPQCALPDTVATQQDGIQQLIESDYFYWLVEDLSIDELDVVYGKMIFGNTFAQIAQETGKPISTISSLYYRALEKIRRKKK